MSSHAIPPFPGFDHIWVLGDPLINKPFRADYDSEVDHLLRYTGFNLAAPPSLPLRLHHGSGGKVPIDNVIWPRASMPPFISDHVVELMRQNVITGWDSFPVVITDKFGVDHHHHHRLMITGTCGPLDWKRGPIYERTEEYPRGKYYLGGWFDPDSWDDSDLFRSIANGFLLVSDRFRNLMISNKIRNLRLTRFSEFEMPEIVLKFGPHR